jgi:hypothetical protein
VSLSSGAREALARLELPERAATEDAEFALHPALLDMATGGAQHLIPGFEPARDFYVPLSYGRLTLYRPLPARLLSHVTLREHGPGVAVFDAELLDDSGAECALVHGFTMRRVEAPAALAPRAPSADETRASDPLARLFADVLRAGLGTEEGLDSLERLLASRAPARVLVSSVDPIAWAEALGAPPEAARDSASAPPQAPRAGSPRVAPRSPLEEEIAGVFAALLGTDDLSVVDNFFEIGGHSLLLIRAVTRIRQLAEVDLPLASAFATPTVAGLAAAVEVQRAEGAGTASSVVVPLARAAYRVKRSDLAS